MSRLVVIGNGMAGVYTMEEVLKIQKDISITIFGDEPHVNYNRILLSEVLAGERRLEEIFLNPREWYAQNRIDLRLGVRVTTIDPSAKSVTDSEGKTTSYNHLLIAVGGIPFIPPIRGVEKQGVFVFRNMEDTQRILAQTCLTKQAVVIGGGLLGLEAARGLINHGVSVTVVHLMDRLMEQQLDRAGATMLKREVERLGIGVMLNTSATEILGDKRVTGIQLTTGQELTAGLVLVCTGIRPNLGLAKAAGLETHLGIVVNDDLQTSAPDIYAVGDVIEHRGKTYGLVAPLRDQAKVIADQLVGQKKMRYEGTVCATILKVAGVKLTSAGIFLGGGSHEETVYMDTQAAIYKKLVFQSNRLVGMILMGDNKDGPHLFNLIQSGQEVSSIKGQLIQMISTQASALATPGISTTATIADTELICNCNSVTKGTILQSIREKNLKTRDEVAISTKATTGCGSCTQLVEDLLHEVNAKKSTMTPIVSAQPTPVEPLTINKPILGYPIAYPKSLDVERIKQEGLGLNFEKIREMGVMALTEDDYYRLKTYGVCSQKHPGYFMVRIRIPGGKVTARQLIHLAELADIHGRGWGHLTSRQDLELHWVRVEEVLDIWESLKAIGLSSRSACGHTLRNVMACSHSAVCRTAFIDVQPWAKAISDYFLIRSDLINPAMPNRLNIYFAGCVECALHAQINDIGFVAVKRPCQNHEPQQVGFEVWVGGSLGAHPILGFKLKEFITPQDVLPVCQAIFHIHTKYGSRSKAKSRLKWLVDQLGQEKFSDLFEEVFQGKRTLPENTEFNQPILELGKSKPSPLSRLQTALALPLTPSWLPPGCYPQRQIGYVRMAVEISLGEIRAAQLRVLAKLSRWYGNGEIHFTPDQNVELHWIRTHAAHRVARVLERNGLTLKGKNPGPQVVACPGTEFCVLAVTNAQGAARDILKRYSPDVPAKAELLKNISIHISGCPNSCAKHQVADIGLAGTVTTVGNVTLFSYLLYLGGSISGNIRLGELVRKGITEDMIIPTIDALLALVLEHRYAGESFQQVIDRLGITKVVAQLDTRLSPFLPKALDRLSMVPDQIEVLQ
ncbi:MAG: FAD-dependent oxidoreductase [Nitrospira sp.]|nr:FAD-dependent oxidoreductase [Nitrospira sp.]